MINKSCCTCEFWDRDNADIYGAINKPRAECLADIPFSVRDPEKSDTTETDGEYCDTYKKIKEE